MWCVCVGVYVACVCDVCMWCVCVCGLCYVMCAGVTVLKLVGKEALLKEREQIKQVCR